MPLNENCAAIERTERKLHNFTPVFNHKSSSLFGMGLKMKLAGAVGFTITGSVGLFAFFSDENPDALRPDAAISSGFG